MTYERTTGDGFTWGVSPGPLCLVVAALVFVVVSRPWRLLVRVDRNG